MPDRRASLGRNSAGARALTKTLRRFKGDRRSPQLARLRLVRTDALARALRVALRVALPVARLCALVALCGCDETSAPADTAQGGDKARQDAGPAGDAATGDAATSDACQSDRDCDDRTFCNGAEHCDPQDGQADARGCVSGQNPCEDGALCDEEKQACQACAAPDGDQDGHDAIACGGDDCDDQDPNRFPGNTELCDSEGHDEDCNPETLGADGDQDEDGFVSVACCNADAEGTLVCGDDCEDELSGVNPGAPEACNDIDDNCDGSVDEEVIPAWYRDDDGDGFGVTGDRQLSCTAPAAEGWSELQGDCDDDLASVNPAASESCATPYDDDCDGNANAGCDCLDTELPRACGPIGADGLLVTDAEGDPLTTGACARGVQECVNGKWATCVGAIAPKPEDCATPVDDDCDGLTNEDDAPDNLGRWYQDADQDGHGNPQIVVESCERPAGYLSVGGDCDDAVGAIHPGAEENCQTSVDDDCDGSINENCDCTDETSIACGPLDESGALIVDAQGQPLTVGACAQGTQDCLGTTLGTCQDYVAPRPEDCNTPVDDDCDGEVNEDDAEANRTTFYLDLDGDGYGQTASSVQACTPPTGYVPSPGDCNDDNDAVHPGATESCANQVDDDCDGSINEACGCTVGETYACGPFDESGTPLLDAQDQPLTEGACSRGTQDCSEGVLGTCQGYVAPQPEDCNTPVDDDCDGSVNEDDAVDNLRTWYQDADEDGFGDSAVSVTSCVAPAGFIAQGGDCADEDPDIYPGRTENCDTTYDDNCNNVTTDGCDCVSGQILPCGPFDQGGALLLLDDAPLTRGACAQGTQECVNGQWTACAGYVAPQQEICAGSGEAGDEDCDGLTNESDATDATLYYPDLDGDGFGDEDAAGTLSCVKPMGLVGNNDDCSDDPGADALAANINPSRDELCDNVDRDCDGTPFSASDINNCTAGNNVESVYCASASCAILACSSGYEDCDTDNVHCETDTRSDADNCGDCDVTCQQLCKTSNCDEFVQLAGGLQHTCARTETGRVVCWGAGAAGLLGTSDTAPSEVPTATSVVQGAIDIAVGWSSSCATNGTTAWCWGQNNSGELGNSGVTIGSYSAVPVAVGSLTAPSKVAVGSTHACAIVSGGEIACWGGGSVGQLGNGSNTASTSTRQFVVGPGATGRLANAIAIALGRSHSCAIIGASGSATSGQVWCWGSNLYGQVGDNDADHEVLDCSAQDCSTVAQQVVSSTATLLSDAKALTAGDNFTCALRASGQVVCWGDNRRGELGNGTETASPYYVNATGMASASAVVARGRHTCALQSGTVSCWGRSDNGQLGDGLTHSDCSGLCSLSKIALGAPLSNVVHIASGYGHSCALLSDGRSYCWGLNTDAQLGIGTSDAQPTPALVQREE